MAEAHRVRVRLGLARRPQSVHRAISRRLHAVGIGGVITLRGVWGFRGDRVPHGGRHVPAVTVVVDAPRRVPAAFFVIDELTAGRGVCDQ